MCTFFTYKIYATKGVAGEKKVHFRKWLHHKKKTKSEFITFFVKKI